MDNIRKYAGASITVIGHTGSHRLSGFAVRAHNRGVHLILKRRPGGLGVLITLAVLLAALHANPAPAQPYTARIWQTQNGLSQQTVQAVTQTQDGFLWIGTTGGLLRFDGSRFVVYERANTPAFEDNSVFCLMTARDGTLWIGSEGGGLISLKDGRFRHFGAAQGLLDGFVRTVLEDRDGNLWIGTDNGLFRMAAGSGGRALRVDGSPSMPPMAVHGLHETRDGTVWAGGSRLVAIRYGVAVDYPLVGEYSETRVKTILQTHDGTVWVGTVSGLQRLTAGFSHFQRFRGVQGTVRTLRETADGALWIGTIGQGAYTLRDGRLDPVAAGRPTEQADARELPSRTVLSISEDTQHNVWMGTQAGLVRFSKALFQLVPLTHAADSDFETISADRDGTLWVASTSLSHLHQGVTTPVTFPEIGGARVRNVFRARNGALWVGTDGRGLFRLEHGRTLHYTTANGLTNNFIRQISESENEDLWVATDEGVNRLSGGASGNYSVRTYAVGDGLVYFSVRAMLEDRSGGLWFGTDHGLSHLVNDRFIHDAATAAMASEKVWAIAQSASGALWFGTRDDGLYRYLPGERGLTHYTSETTEQGLAGNSVYSILQDRAGRFWIGGADGVEVVAISDLEKLAANPRTYIPQHFFAVSEGGELSPLYGGTQPSAAIDGQGDPWFPTSKGPVHFPLGAAANLGVPKVFVDRIVVDGRTLPTESGPIRLDADNRNLEIAYGSILLGSQDAIQFQYKLEDFDRDWRYGSNRRIADYTNLPAGRYVFRVRAFQRDSGELTERSLAIVKQQHFYLTWWFLTCSAALLALLVWWVHRLRLARVRLAFQAVIEERARLAREMHDTLIQGCAGVSLLLEACSVEPQAELLDYARTQLATSIDEARQAVWNLRGQESGNFGDTLMMLAERLDRSSNIEVKCRVDGEAYDFHSSAVHEVAMASREAIYNALLHANPTRIEVRASFGTEEFSLAVEDNGSGFESTEHAPEGHYGLIGIEERIRRLGGSVKVKSAMAMGTGVYIRLPKAAVCIRRQE